MMLKKQILVAALLLAVGSLSMYVHARGGGDAAIGAFGGSLMGSVVGSAMTNNNRGGGSSDEGHGTHRRVDRLSDRIDDLRDQMSEIKESCANDLRNLKNSLDSLQEDVHDLEKRIEGLEASAAKAKNPQLPVGNVDSKPEPASPNQAPAAS